MKSRFDELEDYLGQAESAQLEFKSKRALEERSVIPRAVCALLNTASGGEVVIGIEEADKGLRIDSIPRYLLEAARTDLWNRLLSVIEPRIPEALELHKLSCNDEGGGLVVVVPPGRKDVYAYRGSGGSYQVWSRRGSRVDLLSWREILEEIRQLEPSGQRSDEQFEVAAKDFREYVDGLLPLWETQTGGGPTLFLRLALLPQERASQTFMEREFAPLVQDPTPLGLRRGGWHYSLRTADHREEKGWYRRCDHRSFQRRLEYSRERVVQFATIIDRVQGQRTFWNARHEHETSWVLAPLVLLEFTNSVCRLFKRLVKAPTAGGATLSLEGSRVWGALALLGVRECALGIGPEGISDRDPEAAQIGRPIHANRTSDLIDSLPATEFVDHPDVLAYLLGQRLYDEFAAGDVDVCGFDPARQEFVFPD